jgi:hypothetical protein
LRARRVPRLRNSMQKIGVRSGSDNAPEVALAHPSDDTRRIVFA